MAVGRQNNLTKVYNTIHMQTISKRLHTNTGTSPIKYGNVLQNIFEYDFYGRSKDSFLYCIDYHLD